MATWLSTSLYLNSNNYYSNKQNLAVDYTQAPEGTFMRTIYYRLFQHRKKINSSNIYLYGQLLITELLYFARQNIPMNL